jgi:hypothetical protein
MIYVYGNKEVDGGVNCNPVHKGAISGATLVYTDDAVIKANYEAKGVEVRPLTDPKPKAKRKPKNTKE